MSLLKHKVYLANYSYIMKRSEWLHLGGLEISGNNNIHCLDLGAMLRICLFSDHPSSCTLIIHVQVTPVPGSEAGTCQDTQKPLSYEKHGTERDLDPFLHSGTPPSRRQWTSSPAGLVPSFDTYSFRHLLCTRHSCRSWGYVLMSNIKNPTHMQFSLEGRDA